MIHRKEKRKREEKRESKIEDRRGEPRKRGIGAETWRSGEKCHK
jgi:hypothetical protein